MIRVETRMGSAEHIVEIDEDISHEEKMDMVRAIIHRDSIPLQNAEQDWGRFHAIMLSMAERLTRVEIVNNIPLYTSLSKNQVEQLIEAKENFREVLETASLFILGNDNTVKNPE